MQYTYKVWKVIQNYNGLQTELFYVVNQTTKKVQSVWKTWSTATSVCQSLMRRCN